MKKIYLASQEAYLRGQYKEVCRAFEGIIIEAGKLADVNLCRDDLQRIINADDKEDETKDIFVRPVSTFQKNNPGYPLEPLEDMKRRYLIAYMNTILHLSYLNRFDLLGIPFEKWNFRLERPIPTMTILCWVEDDVLDKYLKEASCVELSEQQCKMMELTHVVCELVNNGFFPMNYIDHNQEAGAFKLNEERLIADIRKMSHN